MTPTARPAHTGTARPAPGRAVRRWAAVLASSLLLTALLPLTGAASAPPAAADEPPEPAAADETVEESGLVEIGVMPAAAFAPHPEQALVPGQRTSCGSGWDHVPLWADDPLPGYEGTAAPATMVVDPVNNLGFAVGHKVADPVGWTNHGNRCSGSRLFVYDLETLELVDRGLGFEDNDLQQAGHVEQTRHMHSVPILPLAAEAAGEGVLLVPEAFTGVLQSLPSACPSGVQKVGGAHYYRRDDRRWTLHPPLEDRLGVQGESEPSNNDPPGHPALPGWGLWENRGDPSQHVNQYFVEGTVPYQLALPCAGGWNTFFMTATRHLPDSGAAKLYTIEVPLDPEGAARRFSANTSTAWGTHIDTRHRAGQTTLLRQYDLATLLSLERPPPDCPTVSVCKVEEIGTGEGLTSAHEALDWELDLALAGCESYNPRGAQGQYWVARVSDAVLTYCFDHRTPGWVRVLQGRQGYVVRVPLGEDDMPGPRPGFDELVPDPTVPGDKRLVNALTRRIPALVGAVVPFADPVSGRVMLSTNDAVNGTAVWVLDPEAERFVGVATHGFTTRDFDRIGGKNGFGFDPETGRAYVFGPAGMLVVDGRAEPPLTGRLVPVLTDAAAVLPYNTWFGNVETEGSFRNRVATVDRLPVVNVGGRPRVIVPIVGRGYVVLEDRVAFPEPHDPPDADRLTEQVDEAEGLTEANHSGAGQASGAHVVVAGGAPRAVNQLSPTCSGVGARQRFDETLGANTFDAFREPISAVETAERGMFGGECLAEQLLASGHREVFFANSDVEAGSWSGAEAEAQSVSFVRADAATDHDLRSASQCHRYDVRYVGEQGVDWMARGGQEPQEGDAKPSEDMAALFDGLFRDPDPDDPDDPGGGYVQACEGPQQGVAEATDEAPFVERVDLSYGTAGDADGRGFPAPVAMCQDGGGNPGGEGAEGPLEALTSSVACNGAIPAAQAGSAAAALVLPGAEDPLVVVEKVSSRIVSRRIVADVAEFTDKALQLTRAEAVASGIQIGPIRIGEVRTFAEVRAGGRTDTTSAVLVREWCDVTFPDADVLVGCREITGPFDPLVEAVRDELAQAFPRLRISVPEASLTASEGGAKAVVTKHEGLRAADDTVNDDDSFIVPALEVLILNDGGEGRNRYLVHLAGVHAEARYTINSIPQFDFPVFDPSPAGDPIQTSPPPADDTDRVEEIFGRLDTGTGEQPPPPSTAGGETGEGFVAGQPGRPPRYEEIVELASGQPGVAGPQVASPLRRVLMAPGEVLKGAWRWLVQNPVEFGLLLVVFSILAIPVYLAQRRRTFEHALTKQAP